jgi:hypothetical protein
MKYLKDMTDEELNKEVAEKVMGWSYQEPDDLPAGWYDKMGFLDEEHGDFINDKNWDCVRPVVERMEALGFKPALRMTGMTDPKYKWAAGFMHEKLSGTRYEHDETMPRTVCRAALAALEEQRDNICMCAGIHDVQYTCAKCR